MMTVPEGIGEKAYRLLIQLLAEQESVEIEFEVVKKEKNTQECEKESA